VKFIACSADAVVADNPHHARSDLPLCPAGNATLVEAPRQLQDHDGVMRKCRGCVRAHTLLLRGVRSPAPLTYICAPLRVCQAHNEAERFFWKSVWSLGGAADVDARAECCRRWGWAVPNAAAIMVRRRAGEPPHTTETHPRTCF